MVLSDRGPPDHSNQNVPVRFSSLCCCGAALVRSTFVTEFWKKGGKAVERSDSNNPPDWMEKEQVFDRTCGTDGLGSTYML